MTSAALGRGESCVGDWGYARGAELRTEGNRAEGGVMLGWAELRAGASLGATAFLRNVGLQVTVGGGCKWRSGEAACGGE